MPRRSVRSRREATVRPLAPSGVTLGSAADAYLATLGGRRAGQHPPQARSGARPDSGRVRRRHRPGRDQQQGVHRLVHRPVGRPGSVDVECLAGRHPVRGGPTGWRRAGSRPTSHGSCSAFTCIEDVSSTLHWMEPDRIVMKTCDRRVANPASTTGKGLWFSASPNPDSADFHPINFNRFAYILEAADKPHPEPVELRQRQLDRRWAMLSPQMQAKILRAIERDRSGQ
jgi:hypothetical protein